MSISFRKLLPNVMRNTRWGDLVVAYQSILNTFKTNWIDVVANHYDLYSMPFTTMQDVSQKYGFDLLSYTGYTSSQMYLLREMETIIPRIKWKTTRTGYEYIYYIFNLDGEVYPIELTPSNLLQVMDTYWSDPLIIGVTSFYLDPTPPDTLDSVSGRWISYLDQKVSSAYTMTRNLCLSFAPQFVESSTEYISLNTLKCLYGDVFQMKKSTEVPYFEYVLNIPGYKNRTIYTNPLANTSGIITAYMKSILTQGKLSDMYSIQIGNGAHTSLTTSITGVQSSISVGGDITLQDYAISGGDYSGSSNAYAFNRKTTYLSTDITQGYQEWGFKTAKTNLSNSGLKNDTTRYSGGISVDGAYEPIIAIGRNAQTLQGVLQEINKSLTGAVASFDSTGNGAIKVTSNSVGINSKIVITSGSLFNALLDRNDNVTSAVNGVNTASSWKSVQTGSGVFLQASIGQTNIPIAYLVTKIQYKNSPNTLDNPSSVKVQWKYDTDSVWNTITTASVQNTASYWNTITVPTFILSGVITTIVNKYVIVGSSGEIDNSTDALVWTKQTQAGGYNKIFRDITETPTMYITVGSSGEIETSTDSTTWTKRTPANSYTGDFRSVGYGSGIIIGIGSAAEIQMSSNGSTWYHSTLTGEASNTLNKIKYENNQFYIVGNGGKLYQSSGIVKNIPSGIIWKQKHISNQNEDDFYGANIDNGLTFVTGNNGDIQKSYDGGYWTQVSGVTSTNRKIYDTIYSGGIYVAVGYDSASGTLITTSTDAINWVLRAPATTSSTLKEVTYGQDKFVTVGTNSEIEYSSDGTTWNKGSIGSPYINDILEVSLSGSGIITCGEYGGVFEVTSGNIAPSNNIYAKYLDSSYPTFNSVIKGNSEYVVVGDETNASVYTSIDLTNWTSGTLAQTTGKLNSIAYGSGVLVTVGDNGHIETSSGNMWSLQTPDNSYTGNFNKVIYGDQFVAVGDNEEIQTSSSGIVWAHQTISESVYIGDLNSIAYGGNGNYVAVGDGGGIIKNSSILPSSGTIILSPISNYPHFGPLCYTTSSSGVIFAGADYLDFSFDGINWISKYYKYNSGTYFRQIAYGNNIYIMRGTFENNTSGSLFVSSDLINWNLSHIQYSEMFANNIYFNESDNKFYSYFINSSSSSGIVASSSNGLTWDHLYSSLVWGSCNQSCYYKNKYYIATQTGLYSSLDNINWNWLDITATYIFIKEINNILFTFKYPDGLYVSFDGTNFIKKFDDSNLTGITYLNNLYFLSSAATEKLYYSYDLDNWYIGCDIINPGGYEQDALLNYNNYLFHINYSNSNIYYTDLNNFNIQTIWQPQTPANSYTGNFYNVAYGNNKYMAIGTPNEVQTSDSSGIVWSHNSTVLPFNITQKTGMNFYDGKFIVGGENGNLWYTANDGNSWNKLNLNYATNFNSNLNSIIYNQNSNNLSITSSDITPWVISYSSNNDIYSNSTQSGNILVICGSENAASGKITYTTDGTTWNNNLITDSSHLYGIKYGNGKFVSVGANGSFSGVISYASNLSTWTSLILDNNPFFDIAFGNNKFIAISRNKNLSYQSNDGINWNSSSGVMANRIIFGNNLFLANYGKLLYTSTSGNIWNLSLISSQVLYGINYCNNSYFAVGASGVIYNSLDGINWNLQTPANNYSGFFSKITYGNELYVLLGYDGEIQVSTDGITWAHSPIQSLDYNNNIYSSTFLYFNNKFIRATYSGIIYTFTNNITTNTFQNYLSVGDKDSTTNYAGLLTSTSGTVWTSQQVISNDNLKKIITAGNNYVTLGDQYTYSGPIGNSGLIWTQNASTGVSAGTLNCIAYSSSNNTYVVVGNSGTIKTSNDLTSWISRTPENNYTGNFNKVVWNGSNFVAAGTLGEVQISPNGINWSHQYLTSDTSFNLQDISYGNGIYIVVSSDYSRIYYSEDLDTWYKNIGPGADKSYYSSAYGNGLFVIVGSNGSILTTVDGITLTPRTADNSYTGTFYSVKHKSGLFVALGTNGEIQISPDGLTWSHESSPNGYNGTYYGAAYVGTNVTSSHTYYQMRLLANSALTTNYYWELFGLSMSTDVLTLRELQWINTLTDSQVHCRRIITERNTFPTFSELALKDNANSCLYYATFPNVQWDSRMLSNPCFNIQIE